MQYCLDAAKCRYVRAIAYKAVIKSGLRSGAAERQVQRQVFMPYGSRNIHARILRALDARPLVAYDASASSAKVASPYFAGCSLITSPPFATGMTQIGVAASAGLSSDI